MLSSVSRLGVEHPLSAVGGVDLANVTIMPVMIKHVQDTSSMPMPSALPTVSRHTQLQALFG
jgi:hypothetical protein